MGGKTVKIIKQIAEKYGIKLHFVTIGDTNWILNGKDAYFNRSACAGKEIWLGVYVNKEQKIASFFHEIGHAIDPIDWSVNANEKTKHKSELWAWEIGFKLAETYGITFTAKTKAWARRQANTYKPNKKTSPEK